MCLELLYQKSRLRKGGLSLSSSPDCNTAKLRNECFSLFMLSSFFKARADTLPGEAKQWKMFGYVIVTFETEVANFEITLPQKHGHRIKTPSSKLMILVSSCWENNSIRNNAHDFFILSLVFLKLLIVGLRSFWATLYIWLLQEGCHLHPGTAMQIPYLP